MTEIDPPYLYPDYRSTPLRAPTRPLLTLPEELHSLGAPVFGDDAVSPADADLTDGEPADPSGPMADVSTLLVEPRWGRRGHGSRLLSAVVDLARSQGVVRLRLWIPDADTVSASFLESAGWEPDGWARTLDTGGAPLRELRWHTVLDDVEGDPA